MHELYLGIGSNLGDRQANLLAALQRLRSRAEIFAVSGFYESEAAGGATGPAYLNVAVGLRYALDRAAFERFARDVESAVGRARETRHLEPRPIDIDLLVFDGEIVERALHDRPYDAVPLREIAPQYVAKDGYTGVRRLERSLRFETDRQSEAPEVRLSLRRAGVTGVRRVVHLEVDGRSNVYNADFSMVADVAPDRTGVHMSRFAEALEEATLDVLADNTQPARIERLAETIARSIVNGQRASSADVRLQARFALERWTPVSGKRGEETYVLIGIAHAGADGTRRIVGVEAEGMTACPCAQGMMREHWLHELVGAGFSEPDANRALDVLPAATHNQRGRGTLLLGTTDERSDLIRAEDLVEIVENAMSSETYDLLKRPDEFFVVNKAHHRPRFVEDVVRAMLARSLELYADFADDTFVFAGQVNEESIHKHDAFAEAFGTFGELRRELDGEAGAKTGLVAWLGSGVLQPFERGDARFQ
jgi:GTP cyclohydrolase-4